VEDLSGKRLQNAPEWTSSAYAQYETQLSSNISVRAKVQYNYAAQKYLVSITDAPRSSVQPTHIVNANIDFLLPHDIQIGVFATNLTNNHYIASVYDAPGTLGLTNYAPPREWGVTAGIKF